MFELIICAAITILPDYLFRRYAQGKRIGREITLFSVWYELRWGITACLFLTISLITLVFFFHPSTSNATALFRTVPILPEGSGRVAEVDAGVNDKVEAGQVLFRLDSSTQEAAVDAARKQISETDAETTVSKTELAAADGAIQQAKSALQQAQDDLATKSELLANNSQAVSQREVEKLQVAVQGRQGAVDAANANKQTLETKISTLLPAQKASAEAALEQAQVELDKTAVRAGVAGTLQQFTLRRGDVVNPMMRSAGVLVPADSGQGRLIAGFGQIEAQVMKVGMLGEVACAALPFTIVPTIVTQVQHVIAGGQLRASDQLIDVQALSQPGTITVYMEPLFAGQFDSIPPGSNCTANAYTNNHDALETLPTGSPKWIFLHVVDTVGFVHAMILRMQAAMMPVQTLVLGGGH